MFSAMNKMQKNPKFKHFSFLNKNILDLKDFFEKNIQNVNKNEILRKLVKTATKLSLQKG